MIAGIAPSLHVVRTGSGPQILLVHGSAADHSTWSIQLAAQSPLRKRFSLVAYDRRADAASVEDHAADAASLIAARSGSAGPRSAAEGRRADEIDRALVVASSFGAVCALEFVRSRPELVAGAVLIEPPMAASDAPAAPAGFLRELDRIAAERGGPAAGERFLRSVLGDASYDRMPRAFQDRAKHKWPEIRADSAALIAYAPRYGELARVATPVLLVGGDRSAPYFRATLEALARTLPHAALETIPNAGHMLHAEAPRRFHELVIGFAERIHFG